MAEWKGDAVRGVDASRVVELYMAKDGKTVDTEYPAIIVLIWI